MHQQTQQQHGRRRRRRRRRKRKRRRAACHAHLLTLVTLYCLLGIVSNTIRIAGTTMKVNGKDVINVGTFNFLGLVGDKRAEVSTRTKARTEGVIGKGDVEGMNVFEQA